MIDTTDPNLLLQLAETQNAIRDKFIEKKRQKYELQRNLTELYQPLTQSATTTSTDIKKSILNRVNEIANANTTTFLEFRNTFSDFPNVVRGIDDLKNSLIAQSVNIVNNIGARNDVLVGEIDKLEQNQKKLLELMTTIKDDPKYAELVELLKQMSAKDREQYIKELPADTKSVVSEIVASDSGYATMSEPSATESAIHERKREKPVTEQFIDTDVGKFEKHDEVIRSTGEMHTRRKKKMSELNDAADLVDILSTHIEGKHKPLPYLLGDSNSHQMLLIRNYVDHFAKYLDLTTKPWLKIKSYNQDVYNELKDIQLKAMQPKQPKKGKGVKTVRFSKKVELLPSNKTELVKEFERLFGSYKSGNTSVYDRLEAVIDELRRQKIISVDTSKKLYKHLY